jgi:photosystem II stability/assembly factor-like uncharacterized protein
MTDQVLALAQNDSLSHAHLIVGRTSGVYQSRDHAATWHPMIEPQLGLSAGLTSAIANRGDHVLLGVVGGVLQSWNGGESWHHTQFPLPSPIISTVLISADHTCIAASLEDGIFASFDGGKTWQPCNYGLMDVCVLSLLHVATHQFLAGTSSGLYHSRNNGRGWSPFVSPLDGKSINALAMNSRGDWFAAAEADGLWTCHADTRQWTRVTALESPIQLVATAGELIAASGDSTVFVSGDHGLSWTALHTFTSAITALLITTSANGSVSILSGAGDHVHHVQMALLASP